MEGKTLFGVLRGLSESERRRLVHCRKGLYVLMDFYRMSGDMVVCDVIAALLECRARVRTIMSDASTICSEEREGLRDDHTAAEQHRLEQARRLLRSVTVIVIPSNNVPYDLQELRTIFEAIDKFKPSKKGSK